MPPELWSDPAVLFWERVTLVAGVLCALAVGVATVLEIWSTRP